MNTVDQQSIEQVLGIEEVPVVSIYMPTHRYPTPPHIQEDMIRLKNSTRKVKEGLEAEKTDERTIRAITRQLETLLDKQEFWAEATEGLAIFVTANNLIYYHLPLECDQYVEVGTQANVTPLLALSSYEQPYYLLALALHQPKLYRGNMYGIERVEIDFPASPEDALNIDEMFSNSNTIRGISTQGGGNDKMSSHGQGDSREAGNEERLKYFRILDNLILSSKTIDETLPLLIAGTDDEVTEYRSISSHNHILPGYVNGNHTDTNERELHELAWSTIQRECHGKDNEELTRMFNERQGTGKSSSDMVDIEEAVKLGRVDSLLLELIASTRDTVSDASKPITKIILSKDMAKKINSLAIATYRQGGKIVAMMGKAMPAKIALAAVYRY